MKQRTENKLKKIIQEILIQYPSLRMWSDNYIPLAFEKIQKEQLVTEFLYTIDPNKTVEQLIKQVGYGVRVFPNSKNIILIFDKLEEDYLNKVNKFMDKFGWYPSYIGGYMKNSGKYSQNLKNFINKNEIEVIYEPKYNEEVNLSDIKYLYHLTPDLSWNKIKSFGLTPKTQGKLSNHPERIYLLKRIDNLENYGGDVMDISFNLLDKYTYKDKVKNYYLLKIDVSKLNPKIKFFKDPNFQMGNGIWTYQNIPPNSISIEEKIDMTH